jgi:hypothetical protein
VQGNHHISITFRVVCVCSPRAAVPMRLSSALLAAAVACPLPAVLGLRFELSFGLPPAGAQGCVAVGNGGPSAVSACAQPESLTFRGGEAGEGGVCEFDGLLAQATVDLGLGELEAVDFARDVHIWLGVFAAGAGPTDRPLARKRWAATDFDAFHRQLLPGG